MRVVVQLRQILLVDSTTKHFMEAVPPLAGLEIMEFCERRCVDRATA